MADRTVIDHRYDVIERIARAGASTVYKVHDRHTRQVVALKLLTVLRNSPDEFARFHREFRLLSSLSHPHIVSVFGTGVDDGIPYFTMEYLDGITLADVLRAPESPLYQRLQEDPQLVRGLLCQACDALGLIHDRGMVHRDVKPANLMLLSPESTPFAKLLDLGTARFQGSDDVPETRQGQMPGTAHYMAPEQIRQVYVDGRADLYALGAILYEILAGRKPFNGDNVGAVVHQHLHELPVPPRVYNLDVPHDLQMVAMRLLEKEPDRRYRTASDLLADLTEPGAMEGGTGPQASDSVPLLHPRFLGRRAEVGRLRGMMASVQRGEGLLSAVSGAPGVGKTRLLEELAADARLQGFQVLTGTCPPAGGNPFDPLVACLRSAEREIKGIHSWVRDEDRDELARLFPELASETRQDIPDEFRREDQASLFAGLFDVLETLSRVKPLFIALDDIQWADSSTVGFLRFASERLSELPVLLCLAHRPFDDDTHPDWLANGSTLALAPLELEATEDLIASLFGAVDAPDGLIDLIYRLSGGNPFHVIEAVKSFVDKGSIVWREHQWVCTARAEEYEGQIEPLIRDRVARLPEPQARLTHLAAVLDRPFSFEMMAAIVPGDEFELLQHLEALTLQRFLSKGADDDYRLFHSLIGAAVRRDTEEARLGKLHRTVADGLASLESYAETHAPQIASHYQAASEDLLALPFLVQAGEQAYEAYAYADASELLGKAVAIIRQADSEVDADTAVKAKRLYLTTLRNQGDSGRLLQECDHELALGADDAGLLVDLHTFSAIASMAKSDLDCASKHLEHASQIAEEVGSTEARLKVLFPRINLLWRQSDKQQAQKRVSEAITLLDGVGSEYHRGLSLYMDGSAAAIDERFADAERGLRAALESFTTLGNRRYASACRRALGEVYCHRGKTEEARRLNHELVADARRTGAMHLVAFAQLALGSIEFSEGRCDGAQAAYEEAASILNAVQHRSAQNQLHLRLAELALERGEVEEAQSHLAEVGNRLSTGQRCQEHRIRARILATSGRLQEAVNELIECLTAADGKSALQKALTLIDYSRINVILGEVDLADAQLKMAEELLVSTGATRYQSDVQTVAASIKTEEKRLAHPDPEATESKGRRLPRHMRTEALAPSLRPLLFEATERLVTTTGSERALILATGPDGIETLEVCSHQLDEASESDISRNVVHQALSSDELILTADAPNDPRFQTSQSIVSHDIRSVVCMPLKSGDDRTVGALYADHAGVEYFSPKDVEFVRAFGAFVGIALDHAQRLSDLQHDMEVLAGMRSGLDGIVGGSPAMQNLYDLIERVAASDIPVLIQGETGTGKGLLARTIHSRSPRASEPFMHQSCAALSHDLLESELFGHARGAFTGALSDRAGLFEAANGGTVFLDEIGDAPPEVQVRLLHVLEEGTVRRVGENDARDVDVRVIAATNRDLEEEVRSGNFREDLYYRLRVVPITLPPLRERAEDIRLLVDNFLKLYPPAREREIQGISPETAAAFLAYNWPGNIRELENELRRGVALTDQSRRIERQHISGHIAGRGEAVESSGETVRGPLKKLLTRYEEGLVRSALAENEWNVTHTARALGISRVGLQGKMKKYGIERPA